MMRQVAAKTILYHSYPLTSLIHIKAYRRKCHEREPNLRRERTRDDGGRRIVSLRKSLTNMALAAAHHGMPINHQAIICGATRRYSRASSKAPHLLARGGNRHSSAGAARRTSKISYVNGRQ